MPSKWMKQSMQQKYEEHRRRVREARSTIDKSKPPEMPMSMRRESERRRQQLVIETDNRLLLDRLGEAMSKKNIDNSLVPQQFVSYLELQRKKQLIKITRENRRLLHRIQHTIPTYHPENWEKDAQKHEEYLRNMTEFPELFVLPGQRPMASTVEGMPDRFADHLGGGITIHGSSETNINPSSILIPPAANYSTRRSGPMSASSQSAMRKNAAALDRSHKTVTSLTEQEADEAVAETEALFRQAFRLNSPHSPHPPPMPPVLQSSASEDEEEDFSRNQHIHRPFLPKINQQPQQMSRG